MEALDSGKIALTDEVTCSEHAAGMGGSQIWLEPGGDHDGGGAAQGQRHRQRQ